MTNDNKNNRKTAPTKPNITITSTEDALLLDFVKRSLPDMPSGKVKSFLEHRQISVNGVVTTKYNFPVKRGQVVSIRQSTGAISGKRTKLPPGLEIIYEDEALIAVNKPVGLLSVATDTEKEKTAFRLLKDSLDFRIFVVHRLDRDTSGVLLFAKSEEIKETLQDEWEKTPRREYLAICEGVFKEKKGQCDTIVTETSVHTVYSSPAGEGKRAVTNYEVIRENVNWSLLKISLETGRKNHIRVHMKELGHPIAGDKKYGASGNPLGRLGLHASLLEIIHPVTKQPLILSAKPDRKFKLPSVKSV